MFYLHLFAAAVVLIAGAQLDSFVTSFIKKEMGRIDPNDRAKAILRLEEIFWFDYKLYVEMLLLVIWLVCTIADQLSISARCVSWVKD